MFLKGKITNTPNSSILLAISLAIFACLLYVNTLGHEFAFDDAMVLSKNYIVQQGWSGIPSIWTTHYTAGFETGFAESYRPMSLTLFAIEWAIFPDSPSFHHLISVLLYTLTGSLLFFTLKKIIPHPESVLFSFIATIIYLVLPVHTEVVANIKGRDDMLAFFFFILTLNCLWTYLNTQQKAYWVGAILAFAGAIFSKENALTFIVILPLTIWFFNNFSIKKIIGICWPFIIPILLYFLIRNEVLYGASELSESALLKVGNSGEFFKTNFDEEPFILNFLTTTFLVLTKYLRLLIYPDFLNAHAFYWKYQPKTWWHWEVILGAMIYIVCSILVLIHWKKKPLLSFCWLFYTISLSLGAYFLIVTTASYTERFLYTPSLGYALALSYAILKLKNYFKPISALPKASFWTANMLPLILTALICLIYVPMTIKRNLAWENSLTLFKTDYQQAPYNNQALFNYGTELITTALQTQNAVDKEQLFEKAESSLKLMIDRNPSFGLTYAQLGLLYVHQGNKEAALNQYLKAIEIRPSYSMAHNDAGMIYYGKGNLEEAEKYFRNAVKANPRNSTANRNLAGMLILKRNYEQAVFHYEAALKFAPNNADLLYFLGNAYIKIGEDSKGDAFINKALELDSTLIEVKFN